MQEQINTMGTLQQTLDVQAILINSENLDEMTKKVATEVREASEAKKEKAEPKPAVLDTELLAIIGSINQRAQILRSKLNIPEPKSDTVEQAPESGGSQQESRDSLQYSQNNPADFDPLKTVSIDFSEDDHRQVTGQLQNDETQSEKPPGLDQTIIIGEMEEGSIFEEMKMDGHGGDLEPSDPSKEVI